MNITIQERRFTFSSEYEISGSGQILRARKDFLSFPSRIHVKYGEDRVGTLQGRFSLIHCKYDFQFADGRDFAFQCEKLRKGVYACKRGDEVYRLYHHKGRRYSIFRNGDQIAAVERNRYVAGRSARFDVRMNQDADVAVVASMVIAMNSSERKEGEDEEAVLAERGGPRREDKAFDVNWQPN